METMGEIFLNKWYLDKSLETIVSFCLESSSIAS